MSRNTEYQFVSTDAEALEAQLVAAYEQLIGTTVHPGSPEKAFISFVGNIILLERAQNNYTGNQNIPSRAEGENLDALADLFYAKERPSASAATCVMRFCISEAQTASILIPAGTRVTDISAALIWETVSDIYIPIGSTYVDVQVRCQTEGEVGNDYELGQINVLVDVFDYYESCENITVSGNGADAATDDEYYELLRESQDAYSTAGPKGAYIYHAKKDNTDIADVVPVRPAPGTVKLYVLMNDGTIAGDEVKNAVLAACNDDYVRPLTDYVSVEDPGIVNYDIAFTYYISRDQTMSAADIEDAVSFAVEEFQLWQSGKLGRDINPSYLIQLLMATGIKRVEVMSPIFSRLSDGSDGSVPQVAQLGDISIVNGGYEDE